MESLLGKLGRT